MNPPLSGKLALNYLPNENCWGKEQTLERHSLIVAIDAFLKGVGDKQRKSYEDTLTSNGALLADGA